MSDQKPHSRAVIKLSGSAFGEPSVPLSRDCFRYVAGELSSAAELNAEIAVVVGGGNVVRGAHIESQGAGRLSGDYCGMLATIINALFLQQHLLKLETPCSVLSARPVEEMVERFETGKCVGRMRQGHIVLIAGGTGNPYFTTDTAAALRAMQLEAEIVLKATRVEGVYSSDPEKNEGARLFKEITYRSVLEEGLEAMDLASVGFCMEHSIPIRVFNFAAEGNICRALRGEAVGTLIGSSSDVS